MFECDTSRESPITGGNGEKYSMHYVANELFYATRQTRADT